MVQLRYFVTAVRLGSYAEASRSLYISQQAISKAVGELEKEVGVSLLLKDRQRFVLTAFGEVFYQRAEELIVDFDDLITLSLRQSREVDPRNEVSIAAAYSPFRGRLFDVDVFDRLRKTYPDIAITVIERSSGDCFSACAEEVVDAAIIIGRPSNPDLRCVKLFAFTPRIAMSRDHPLASKESLTFEDLRQSVIARPDDLRYCSKEIANRLEQKRCEFSYVDVPSSLDEHQKFFDAAEGIMFVPDHDSIDALYRGIAIRPLSSQEGLVIPVCLVTAVSHEAYLPRCVTNYLLKALSRRNTAKRTIRHQAIEIPHPSPSTQLPPDRIASISHTR